MHLSKHRLWTRKICISLYVNCQFKILEKKEAKQTLSLNASHQGSSLEEGRVFKLSQTRLCSPFRHREWCFWGRTAAEPAPPAPAAWGARQGSRACTVPAVALPVSAAPSPAPAGGGGGDGDGTGAAQAGVRPRLAAAGHDSRPRGRGCGYGPRLRAAALPGGQATVCTLLRDLLLPPRAG